MSLCLIKKILNGIFVILIVWFCVQFLLPAMKLEQGNIFRSVCQEFCSQGGWYPSMHCRLYPSMSCRYLGVVSQHALQVSKHTPKGKVEGSGRGGLQDHTQGGIPVCPEADTPSRWLLLQAVCILLECLLVANRFNTEVDKLTVIDNPSQPPLPI